MNIKKYLLKTISEMETKKGKVTKEELELFKTKISYFQHERLIHLIVTVAYAMFTVIFFYYGYIETLFFVPFIALIIFLICYIKYYFFLENHVQYLYQLYEDAWKKIYKK